jgi:pyruvate formate lyase activating enzyme
VLHEARRIALDAGIKFCYIGNLISNAEHTYCPSCAKLLLRRLMYSVSNEGMQGNRCRSCQTVIPGVFS